MPSSAYKGPRADNQTQHAKGLHLVPDSTAPELSAEAQQPQYKPGKDPATTIVGRPLLQAAIKVPRGLLSIVP